MKASQLLRKSLLFLATDPSHEFDRSWCICYAVNRAAEAESKLCDPANRLSVLTAAGRVVSRIEYLLAGSHTVTHWLRRRYLISHSNLSKMSAAESMEVQQYRLRWVNHLIAEFEAQGD